MFLDKEYILNVFRDGEGFIDFDLEIKTGCKIISKMSGLKMDIKRKRHVDK